MFEKWRQETLQCNKCKNKLAELDMVGIWQNVCPFCDSVNSCEPIEDIAAHSDKEKV